MRSSTAVPCTGCDARSRVPANILVEARRARGRAGRDCGRAGDARDGGRRRAEEVAAERHRQTADDQLLGDLVRAVRERVPRSGSDLSHVPGAERGVRDGVDERPGGEARRARIPAEAPRLPPESQFATPTSMASKQPSTRRCRRPCHSQSSSRQTATSSIRSSALGYPEAAASHSGESA